jgi:hypothetical protein
MDAHIVNGLREVGAPASLIRCTTEMAQRLRDGKFMRVKSMPDLTVGQMLAMVVQFKATFGVSAEKHVVPHWHFAHAAIQNADGLDRRIWYWVLLNHAFGRCEYSFAEFCMFWMRFGAASP